MNLIKDTSPVRYGLVITYLLMLAAFVFVIIHIGKNKLFFPHYILISFFVLIIIGITATQQLIYIISSIENISFRGSDKIISHLYSTGIAFIILLVCLFFLIFIIGKVNKKIFTLQEIKAQHKLEEAEYEAIISNNKILRTWKHEYINHLQTLFYMINTNKNDKAQEYIQQLTDEMHNSTQAINSGNFAVDAILSMKQQEMQNNNIQFNSTIYLPEPQTIPLNDAQISALLGNLLNNAIEAAKETKVPTINLSIKPVIDNLVIEMTNSSVGNYKYNSSNELISSKGKNRGIGLKRITDIVQRVDGFVEFKPEPNLFTTKIIVPLLDNAI